MSGLGIQKGYLGGYYGTNAWNAKTLRMYTETPEFGRGKGTKDYNVIDQRNEESYLFDLFIQRFNWNNLPVPEYYLEQCLLFNGMAVAYIDEAIGETILPCIIENRNVYNEPLVVRAIGLNLNRAVRVGDDYIHGEGILLYDNPLFFPPFLQLERSAQILADLHRTMEVYGWGLKSPLLLYASDETVKSIKMTAQGILENEPYRVIIKDTERKGEKIPLMSNADLTAINTPNKASELRGLFAHMQAYRSQIMSMYGFSGISGANKMAQTSSGEVDAANSLASANLERALSLRKRFCKGMNELFKLTTDKITVKANVEDVEDEQADSKGNKGENKTKGNRNNPLSLRDTQSNQSIGM